MKAVLLAGGWAHPPAMSGPLAALLADLGYDVLVVDDPREVTDALEVTPDLLVVNACWFAMADARYTDEQRYEFAVRPDDRRRRSILATLKAGTPLLAMHTAVLCFDGWADWVEVLGAEWDWAASFHPPPSPIRIEPTATAVELDLLHEPFTLVDEEYQQLQMTTPVDVLARSSNGHPLVWSKTHGPTRVAVDLLGHGRDSLDNEGHAQLLANLITWLSEGAVPGDSARLISG